MMSSSSKKGEKFVGEQPKAIFSKGRHDNFYQEIAFGILPQLIFLW